MIHFKVDVNNVDNNVGEREPRIIEFSKYAGKSFVFFTLYS